MAWTYLLTCADGSFYVGSTRDLEQRIDQHQNGRADSFTSRRRPVRLSWALEFERVDDAWMAERQIHGWSRAKKQALIDGRIDDLKLFARNYTEFGTPAAAPDEASSGSASVPES